MQMRPHAIHALNLAQQPDVALDDARLRLHGIPRSPSRNATRPAFMLHPPVRRVSSACCDTGTPSPAAAVSAARITSSSSTGLPSSVNPTAPARTSAWKSVISSPRLPKVAAGMASRFTTAPRSGASIHFSSATESFTGVVFGIATTMVNPPAAAAAVPVAMVSLCVCPGSRRCTWISISPGATTQPAASICNSFGSVFARPASAAGLSTAATRPSRSSTSRGPSIPLRGIDHVPADNQQFTHAHIHKKVGTRQMNSVPTIGRSNTKSKTARSASCPHPERPRQQRSPHRQPLRHLFLNRRLRRHPPPRR